MINNAAKRTKQELVGYVEVMDQTPYLVGGNSDWDPGANHSFFPCLSMALVLWTAENSYASLDYSIIYTCTQAIMGLSEKPDTCSITTFHMMNHHMVFSYIV